MPGTEYVETCGAVISMSASDPLWQCVEAQVDFFIIGKVEMAKLSITNSLTCIARKFYSRGLMEFRENLPLKLEDNNS